MKPLWHEKTADAVHDENNIKGFFGDFRWLSNFENCTIHFEGMIYTSSEAAYQAAKTTDLEIRDKFTLIGASESKKLGRSIAIRPDWDNIKLKVMKEILVDKFTRNSQLKEKLLATDYKYLEETNWWNDKFWGVCNEEGSNNLGRLLMEIRESLK